MNIHDALLIRWLSSQLVAAKKKKKVARRQREAKDSNTCNVDQRGSDFLLRLRGEEV